MRRWLPGPATILLLATALPVALSPLKSPDLFFHLAGGRWLLEHGFATRDPFSVTGTQWVLHEWGFGVMCELLVRALGAAGPELFIASLVVGWGFVYWHVLTRASSGAGLLVLVVFALSLDALSYAFSQERPFHVAHLFFALTLLALRKWRAGDDRALWWLVPLGVVWVNFHGSWLLSPIAIALVVVGSWLERRDREMRSRAVRGLLIAGITFLVAAISPNGLRTFLYPLKHSRLPSTQSLVEWWPFSFTLHWEWSFALLCFLALWIAGNATERRLGWLLPATIFACAALRTERHIPFATMMLGVAIAEHARLQRPLARHPALTAACSRLQSGMSRWSARASGGWLVIVVLVGLVVRAAVHPIDPRLRSRSPFFDIELIEKLRELPPGRVLNRFSFGGPISYFAGPEYKVFIDSRNDPFPLEIHDAYRKLLLLDDGWREALDAYDPDYLMWSSNDSGHALLEALRDDPRWTHVAERGPFVLWIRNRARK